MLLNLYLSPAQIAALRAALNRIIPADEFPGAWEAGVADYLAEQFTGDLAEAVSLYQAGLIALDSEALAQFGSILEHLDAVQQDALLTAVEQGKVQKEWPVSPRLFFNMLAEHAAEGFYGDPGNGGNHDKISWQMIGFPDR